MGKDSTSIDGLKTILLGAGFAAVGLVLSKIFQYGTRAVVARYDTASYGLFSIALTTITLAFLLSTLGLDQAVLFFATKSAEKGDREGVKRVIRRAISIALPASVAVAIALYLGAGWLANAVFRQPDAAPLIAIAALAIPFTVLAMVLAASFRALRRIEYEVATRSLVETGARLAFIVLFLYVLGLGIEGAALGLALGSLAAAAMAIYLLYKLFPGGLGFNGKRSPLKEMLYFALPLALVAVLYQLIPWIAMAALSINSDAVQVGVLSAVLPTADIMFLFPIVLFSLFVPAMTKLIVFGKKTEARATFTHLTKWSLMGQLPIAILIIYYSAQLLSALFGPAYAAGSSALVLLAAGYFIHALFLPSLIVLQIREKPLLVLASIAVGVVLSLVLSYGLAPGYGILGVSAGAAAAMACYGIVGGIFAKREYGVQIFSHYHYRVLAASLVAFAVLTQADKLITNHALWELGFLALVYAIVYIPALWLLGGLEENDIALLHAIRKKAGL
ncbi:hypothetical protein AUJ14_02830 [Candidatus Micrarchaeota archaeon CG1_02_55_22]|nr:MAG: hypothetical protein AUJ14_02830 [Candidatus Micrarchaeota archaeon CG1_02_55_22]